MKHETTDMGISRWHALLFEGLAISFNDNIILIYSDLNHNNGEVLSDNT